MTRRQRILIPIGAGIFGALSLTALYFGIVSWAESPQHALELLWQDRWIVGPIILGFGVQAGLYIILKKGLFLPIANMEASGAMTGAGGSTSALAMAACCAHHVSDVFPILGLTVVASFFAEYRLAFMWLGLGTTLVGIAMMLRILIRERRKALENIQLAMEAL